MIVRAAFTRDTAPEKWAAKVAGMAPDRMVRLQGQGSHDVETIVLFWSSRSLGRGDSERLSR
jgi:hypothetical protein